MKEKAIDYMIKIVLFIVVLLCFANITGCINGRIPKKRHKASLKLEKHLEVIKDIVEKYPTLTDTVSTQNISELNTKDLNIIAPEIPIDSLKFNNSLLERDSLVKAKNDLEFKLKKGDLTKEEYKEIEQSINDISYGIDKTVTTIMKSVYKDTTINFNNVYTLIIEQDTIPVSVNGILSVNSGNVEVSVDVFTEKSTITTKHDQPLFNIIHKIKGPKWLYAIIFVAAIFILLKMVK